MIRTWYVFCFTLSISFERYSTYMHTFARRSHVDSGRLEQPRQTMPSVRPVTFRVRRLQQVVLSEGGSQGLSTIGGD